MFKTLFRTAVIGTALSAAVLGGTAMIVRPERVGAMADQVTSQIETRFDDNLDDPVVLRRQLEKIRRQYPERIRTVRRDLASLQEELRRLEHEQAVSSRVVQMVDKDLAVIGPALEEAKAELASNGPRLAAIEFDGEVLSLRRARIKAREIERTRTAHAARAADAAHNLKYLQTQESRFVALLEQLEEEQATLSAQVIQLENEVESIARNERLIGMLEARQRTLESAERFKVGSLDQLTGVLERKRTEQEAELDRLAAGVDAASYEDLAERELSAEERQRD
ncbi:MAG: hypothetical protein VX460_14665 [Planctomycetota bacterium]|nr:hypothetical protein [Planctomycetota bacterium]